MPTSPQPYVNLHAHTIFSIKDGHAPVEQYVEYAASLGHPAVGVTDHGTVAAIPLFIRAAKKAGIKPILGCEIYVTRGRMGERGAEFRKSHHLTLLAMNLKGYQNIIKLSSAGFLDGFYYNPRVDHEMLARHREGVICLSGCLAGELSYYILAGEEDKVDKLLDFYQEVYGDRFYLEMQNHGPLLPMQTTINKEIARHARKRGIPVVGTNDSHFCHFADAPAHRALMNLKGGKDIKSSPYTYMRPNEEMALAFPASAIKHTLAIAEQIEVYEIGSPVPKLPVSPMEASVGGIQPSLELRNLVMDGLQQRLACTWDEIPFDYEERMDEELSVIRIMGEKLGVPFERYLLIIADIARFCRQERIRFGPRGSAAGSLVCWTLGISEPDPIKEKLLFERFLNPYRVELPDVDMDFQDDKRDLVLQYFVDTYGTENVSRIGTYAAIAAKGAIRDACRIVGTKDLGRPYMEVGSILSGLIPHDSRPGGIPLDEVLSMPESPLAKEVAVNPVSARVINIARQINGRLRGMGTHAAGVVISDQPLRDIVPLTKVTNVEKEVIKQQTQYEMGELESLGLLKFDILGLQTLSMMEHAVEIIERATGTELDLWKLPTDDPKVWEIFASGDTLGLFQLGSRGMTRAIMSVRPHDIQELAMVIAVFRPGPIDNLPTIAARKHGQAEMVSIHPSLDEILGETFGIPVYQEQIMKMMQIVAGFSLGEADVVRKAMSKKKRELMASFKLKFDEGGLARGYTSDDIEKIWNFIVPFADYGFNRAHAVCYAYLAYQSAWLKVHHPVAFYAAALSIEARAGSKSGETSQERIGALTLEAKRRGITVLPPTLNKPTVTFEPEGPHAVRYGLSCIKNVGRADAELIVAEHAKQPFVNLADFTTRTRTVNRKVYEELINANTMPFGNRPSLKNALEPLVKQRRKNAGRPRKGETIEMRNARVDEQRKLLNDAAILRMEEVGIEHLPEAPLVERLQWELDSLGIIVSSIPRIVQINTTCGLAAMLEHRDEQVCLTGVLAAVSPFITKKGKHMATGTIIDTEGSAQIVIWPSAWAAAMQDCTVGQVVVIYGKIVVEDQPLQPTDDPDAQNDGPIPASSLRVLVDHIQKVDVEQNDISETSDGHHEVMPSRQITIPSEYSYQQALDIVAQLTQVAADHPGDEELTLSYRTRTLALTFSPMGILLIANQFVDLAGATIDQPEPVIEEPRTQQTMKERMDETNRRRDHVS